MNNIEYDEKMQKQIAKILKAKRIEKKMNLEELSEGICSISYLSRMENGFVKLQDPYVKKLFEKLDINYEDLKKSRQNNLFLEVIKKNLLNQKNEYQKLLDEIATQNHYLDIEQELILLYDAIVNKRYEEVEIVMETIDKSKYIFSNNEKLFYMYLCARYYLETMKTDLASHHIKSMMYEKIDNDILYWVIFELKLSLSFITKDTFTYINDYHRFIKDAPQIYFATSFEIHKYKMAVLLSFDNYFDAIDKMNDYFKELPENNDNIKKQYYYHLGLIYLNHQEYRLLLTNLMPYTQESNILMLCVVSYMNLSNKEFQNLEIIMNNYKFSKYDELLKIICQYVYNKVHNSNILILQSLVKNKIFKLFNIYYNKYIYDIFVKELLMLNIRCSKYKEACNIILSTNNHQRLLDI